MALFDNIERGEIEDIVKRKLKGNIFCNSLTATTTVTAEQVIATEFLGRLQGQVSVPVKNTGASILYKGTPVYITGTVGATTTLEVEQAFADDPSKMPAVGLVLDDSIAVNGQGHAVILGTISKADTSGTGWTVGKTLYVAPSTDPIALNGLTITRPTAAGDLVQNLGRLGRINSNTGEIIVSGSGRSNDVPNTISTDIDYTGTHDFTGATVLGATDYVANPNIKNDMNALGELTAANSGGSTSFTTTFIGTTESLCIANSGTGTSATGRAFVGLAASDAIEFGTRAISYTAVHSIPILSNGTIPFTVRSGFLDSNSGAGVDGAYFFYQHLTNSGNWSIVTQSNSIGPAPVDTGVAVVAGSWYKFRIEVNAAGTSVKYYINGTLVHTETASIPTGSTRRLSAGFGIIKSASGSSASRSLYTDYFEVAMEGSTR